jgi:ferredoxin
LGIKDLEIIKHDMMNEKARKTPLYFSKDDLVILGMPTATKLFGFANDILNLLHADKTPIICVVLYGNGYYGSSLKIMRKEVEKKGFIPVAAGAFIGQSSYDKSVATGRPDDKDKKIQIEFGKSISKKIFTYKNISFDKKIHIDWAKDKFSKFKALLVMILTRGIETKLPDSWCEYEINVNKCTGCKTCERICPTKAINIDNKVINPSKCIGCCACVNICPQEAIGYSNKTLIKIIKHVSKNKVLRREPELFI